MKGTIKLDAGYKKSLIFTLIGVCIYIVIGYLLPYSEPLTQQSMRLLGIFVMTIFLWSTVSTTWPSILACFMLGTTGYCTGTVALKECFGHGMTVFVAFMLMFNVALSETGLSRRIALFFVTRKFLKGKPWMIMIAFMFSVWVLSAFVTSSAVFAIFLSIAEEMLAMTGADGDDDELPEAMYCTMAWVDQINQGSTPMSHVNVLLGMSLGLSLLGFEPSVLTVCICGLLGCFAQFVLVMLELRFIQKPDVSKLGALDIDALKSTLPPMSKREKGVAVAFIVLIIMWVFPQTIMKIPGLEAFGSMLNNLGTYAPPLLIIAVCSIVHIEGRPLLDLKDACKKINWGAWLMMAALMGMASFLGKSDYGVMPWIQDRVGGAMVHIGVPGLVFCWIAIVIVGVLTNFMSNTASASLINAFGPVAALLGGCNPLAMCMCVAMICNSGFMLPSANPVMGYCCSLPKVRVNYCIKYGIIASILCIIAVCFVAYPIYDAALPVILELVTN